MKDGIDGVFLADVVDVAKEGDGVAVTGKCHKSEIRRDLEERAVDVERGMREGQTLGRSDSLSTVAAGGQGLGTGVTGGKYVEVLMVDSTMANLAFLRGKAGHVEQGSDVLRTTVGPSAVEVEVRSEVMGLRDESLERRIRVKRVVGSLEGITKDDDERNACVDGGYEIQVARGHFVDLVNDEDARGFEKASFPSRDAPILVFRETELLFPVGAEVTIRNRDAKVMGEGGSPEERLQRAGLAAPGKTGEVDEAEGSRGGKIDHAVKAKENLGIG